MIFLLLNNSDFNFIYLLTCMLGILTTQQP